MVYTLTVGGGTPFSYRVDSIYDFWDWNIPSMLNTPVY